MLKIKYYLLSFLMISLINVLAQDQTVGLFTNDSRSFNGYTLFNPMSSTTTYLIDNCGYVINSWQSTYDPNLSVYLLEDGSLLKMCRIGTNPGGRLEKYDWDGNLTWSYNFDSQFFKLHHDIEPLPNGNILILSVDIYTPSEAISAGRNPGLIDEEFWAEKIIEIEPVGTDAINIIWEWKAWDHLVQDFDALKNNYGIVADHPELLNVNYSASLGPSANTDWIHANALSYNPELDQILVCSRNLSEIFIIDHSTSSAEAAGHTGGLYGRGGDILYRYGNPASYDSGNSNDQTLFFQHDAQWISEGLPNEGKILLFNNQASATTSSVVMILPPTDSTGFYSDPGTSFYGPSNFSWVFESSDIYAKNLSGAQQLPNGNILICPGTQGRIIEVDVDGNLLWEYVNPSGSIGPVNQGEIPLASNVFKSRRYAPDFEAFIGIDLVPGDPIELNPWPSNCVILEDTLAQLDLKVFLEGPFNGITMDHQLYDINAIPLSQPYNQSPWNYKGTEAINTLPEPDIIDWVLVEFRDTTNAASAASNTTISRQAGFLLSDGSIVGIDGNSNLKFYNTINQNLFIVVWHRNHLGILSAFPLEEVNEFLSYDFSTSIDQVYNNALGHIQLAPGIWGMIAGDANQDQQINDLDKDEVWNLQTGEKNYLPADFNMDSQINNTDKNDFWYFNKNRASQVPN